MAEKEAELTALEATESASPERAVAEATESPAAEVRGEELPVSRGEMDQLQAEYDQLKKARDGLIDRLARLQAEFENARKRAEKERPISAITRPDRWWSNFFRCWTISSWR